MRLRLRDRTLQVEAGRPVLMGIVNASPESFSDGASVGGLAEQVAAAVAQVEQGATFVDVGGESGVTDRAPVTEADELRRVAPLIERLSARGVPVSIDTWKPAVARAAVDAGAVMVNDVSGLRDPALAELCAKTGAALVITHTRAEPKRKELPAYDDVVADVADFLADRLELCRRVGLDRSQVVIDPGPDLGKTPAQTVAVLRALPQLAKLGRPILLAVSRKDFLGALTGRAPRARLAGTLAAIDAGVAAGAAILRVHDVAAAADFLAVRSALAGDTLVPEDLRLAEGLRREPVP